MTIGLNADGDEQAAPNAIELLASLPGAIVVTDLDGMVVRWFGQAGAIFGYASNEAVGQHVSFLHRPDVRNQITGVVVESVLATGMFKGDVPCVRKDGTEILIETTARAVSDRDGTSRWIICIHLYVTDRKLLKARELEYERMMRLQSVTAALSSAFTAKEVAGVVVDHGVRALGARAGSVMLLDDATGMLELLDATGYPQDALERFARAPLDAEFPPAYAVRTGEPLFLSTAVDRRRHFPGLVSLVQANGGGAMAVLPLTVDNKVFGAIGFNFPEPRFFDAPERAFLLTLSRLGAQAVRRAQLFQLAERSRAEAIEARDSVLRLQQVTARLSRALTPDEVGRVVLEAVLESIGGVAGLLVLTAEGGEHVDVVVRVGRQLNSSATLSAHTRLPVVEAARTGELVWLADADADADYAVAQSGHEAKTRWRCWIGVPVVFEGKPIGAFGIARETALQPDVTHTEFLLALGRQCGQALERARLYERAREADRRKDEFLAVLGHELRNPLAPIVTAIEVMRLRPAADHERERGIIERQVKHVCRLVDDLLDISRITRGRVELRREPVDLDDVIARAVEMTSPLLDERRHQFTVTTSRGVIIDGDPARLAQVVSNVIANAARYTDRGGTISVKLSSSDHHAEIAVTDNGPGIDPELLPRLFLPFVQGAQRSDRSSGGLGLGLAIVRSLVEQHGGSATATSRGLGQGTTLTLRFPLARPTPSATVEPGFASHADVGGPAVPRQRSILIVDDNQDAAMMLSEFLEQRGHRVEVAGDGPSALARVVSFEPDIALLDIGLPCMDGYELARKLREVPGLAAAQLIALTGYGQREDVERARAAGFDRHFVKPIALDELVRVVEDHRYERPPSRSE